MPVLLDVERPRPGLRELLPLVDFVISSTDFPRKLAAELSKEGALTTMELARLEEAEAEGLAAFLLRHCASARWVCVTLGSLGALALERPTGPAHADGAANTGGVTRVPAWPLPADGAGAVRDTTGAGDAFIGATAAALRLGLPLADTLRLASYVAAANCGGDGARGGMPRLAELPAELRALLEAPLLS